MKTISEGKLEDKLTLQDKSIWQKLLFWKKAELFYEADLISDLDLIKNFYQKEGFLDVEVDSKIKELPEDESVEIEFIINENEPVLIEEINYNLQIADSTDTTELGQSLDQLVANFSLSKGERFRDEDLLSTQGGIRLLVSKARICLSRGKLQLKELEKSSIE